MKVKIFQGMSEKKLEKAVNHFIANPRIKVTDIQYSTTIFFFSVMIVYEEE